MFYTSKAILHGGTIFNKPNCVIGLMWNWNAAARAGGWRAAQCRAVMKRCCKLTLCKMSSAHRRITEGWRGRVSECRGTQAGAHKVCYQQRNQQQHVWLLCLWTHIHTHTHAESNNLNSACIEAGGLSLFVVLCLFFMVTQWETKQPWVAFLSSLMEKKIIHSDKLKVKWFW